MPKQSVAVFAARFLSDCRLAGRLDSYDRHFSKHLFLKLFPKKILEIFDILCVDHGLIYPNGFFCDGIPG